MTLGRKELVLKRFCYSDVMGTFGSFELPNGETLYTVELPWRNNQRNTSCIPDDSYICRPAHFHRGDYAAVQIMDVPERDLILFHIANTIRDLRGCIGIGETLGFVDSCWAVLNSRRAFAKFMQYYGNADFELHIQPTDGADLPF